MKSFIASTIFLSIFFSQGLLALDFPANFSLHNKAKKQIWVRVINPGFKDREDIIGEKGKMQSPGAENRQWLTYSIDGDRSWIGGDIVAVPKDKYYAANVKTNKSTIVHLFDNDNKDLIATITFKENVSNNSKTLHISYNPSASPIVRSQRGAWLGLKSTTVLGYDLDKNVKDNEITVKN
jgi:hypothetical protein